MNSFYAIHKLIINEKRRINNINVKNEVIRNRQIIELMQKELNKIIIWKDYKNNKK